MAMIEITKKDYEEVEAKIIAIDHEKEKITLSIKAMTPAPEAPAKPKKEEAEDAEKPARKPRKQKTEEIVEYIKHRVEKQTGFWSNLKKQFSINNNDDIKKKPGHLRPLAIALQDNETEEAAFLEKYGSQIVEVKTTQDLLRNLLTERY